MKILVTKELKSIGLAFAHSGFQVYLYDKNSTPAFDVFDRFSPDLCILDGESIDAAVLKCLVERPHVKIVLFVNHSKKYSIDIEQTLNDAIGENYYLVDYLSIHDPISFKNEHYPDWAKNLFDKKYAARLAVVETSPIEGIETLEPELKYGHQLMIFSTCRVINHPCFCGIINENEIPAIFASSLYVLTNVENLFNAYSLKNCLVKTNTEDIKSLMSCEWEDVQQPEFDKYEKMISGKDSFSYAINILKGLKLNKEASLVEAKRGEFL